MTETAKFSRPVVHRNQDGRLEVFVVAGGYLFNKWQKAPNGDWTDTWNSLGRPWNSVDLVSVVVGSNQDGRLEAFALGKDFALWQNWQIFPNAGWSGWKALGRPMNGVPFTESIVVSHNQDGRLEIFAFAQDDVIYHIRQIVPNGAWNNWERVEGLYFADVERREEILMDVFTVGQNADGRQEIFAADKGWSIWHIWQTSPNGGWVDNGTRDGFGHDVPYNLFLHLNQNSCLELFVRRRGELNVMMQVASNEWPRPAHRDFKPLGKPSQQVQIYSFVVGRNQDGRSEVFAFGQDGALWQIWQVDPNGNWSAWKTLGSPEGGLHIGDFWGIAEQPSVANNQDGRQEVFALGNDNAIWHIGQTAPNNGWGEWRSLGTPKP